MGLAEYLLIAYWVILLVLYFFTDEAKNQKPKPKKPKERYFTQKQYENYLRTGQRQYLWDKNFKGYK